MKLGGHMDYSRIPRRTPETPSVASGELGQASCRSVHGLGETRARNAPEARCAPGSRDDVAGAWRGAALLRPWSRPRPESRRRVDASPWPIAEDEVRLRRPIAYRTDHRVS